jgi:hypothetical protein
MDKTLYKNIIATITYYDVLDYPLTSFEVWKQLIRYSGDNTQNVWSLAQVVEALNDRKILRYVAQKNGMYFLFGREKLVDMRRKREYISFQKMRRLNRLVSILKMSPFVRMICVTGRLSYANCDENSDLDVLIAYEKGHIWTGRFMMTMFTQIMGVRRQDGKTKNRICLNYHVTIDSLDLPTRDLFASHEYTFIVPVFDKDNYFARFCKKNMWIQQYKPHYRCMGLKHTLTQEDNLITKNIRAFGEMILGDRAMEKRLAKIQHIKIIKNPKTLNDGALILCNDKHLIFLPSPHGPEVFEEYKKRYEALELDF